VSRRTKTQLLGACAHYHSAEAQAVQCAQQLAQRYGGTWAVAYVYGPSRWQLDDLTAGWLAYRLHPAEARIAQETGFGYTAKSA
jgi:hypothetical protein